MRIIKIIFILILYGVSLLGISQEIIYDTEFRTSPKDIKKDKNGDFIISGYENIDNSDYFWRSFLIKLTPDFDTTVLIIDDTLNQLFSPRILITQNNRYIVNFVENLEGTGGICNQLSFMVFDEDFNILSFKRYDMGSVYAAVYMNFIQNDDGRIYGFGHKDDLLYVMEINEMADTLRTMLIDPVLGYPSGSDVLESHNDTVAIHAIVSTFDSSTGTYKFVTIDTGFNNYTYYPIILNDNKIPYSISANWINDSIYIGVGFIPEVGNVKNLAIYRANVNNGGIPEGDYLYIIRPDTQDMPARNIPTFVDLNHIYIGSYRGSDPGASYNGRFMVCIIDENLNLLGMKSLGKDGYQYEMHAMQATDDLGCIVIGTRHDNANAPPTDWDIFIRKIMPDEIVEVAEHTEDPYDSDYFIYPNPGSDELNINTARKEVELRIVDIAGKEVIRRKLNDTFLNTLNVTQLPSGNYLLQFKDKEGYQESLKWIKK
jgi:hypothetical protein